MNQTVITASSDRTIRAWSPHAAEGELAVPALIGHHTDYVRSLAFAKKAGVLFSGALDRDISVWDIASPRPHDPVLKVRLSDIDDSGGIGFEGEWGSIYALGVGELQAANTRAVKVSSTVRCAGVGVLVCSALTSEPRQNRRPLSRQTLRHHPRSPIYTSGTLSQALTHRPTGPHIGCRDTGTCRAPLGPSIWRLLRHQAGWTH
jgi:hypothetical protein